MYWLEIRSTLNLPLIHISRLPIFTVVNIMVRIMFGKPLTLQILRLLQKIFYTLSMNVTFLFIVFFSIYN